MYTKPHLLMQKVTKHDPYRALMVPISVLLIHLDLYMLNERYLNNILAPPPPPKKGVILHPYLPITTTPLQRPLSSVPKMTIVERFDCSLYVTGQHEILLPSFLKRHSYLRTKATAEWHKLQFTVNKIPWIS